MRSGADGDTVRLDMRVTWQMISVLAVAACEPRATSVSAVPRSASAPSRLATPPVLAPSESVARRAGPTDAKAPSPSTIHYVVVEPTEEDPDAGKAGVFAERNGANFAVSASWANVRCLSVVVESDLDGDGQTDALISDGGCSSYTPPYYHLVMGTMGDHFVAQELGVGVDIRVEAWRGRQTAVLKSNNEGYNLERPQEMTRRFAFERGRAVVVDEQHAVEQKALANLRAEDFLGANPGQEKILSFDLDGDGKKDALAGTLWERWGRILWQIRFADGRVSDGGNDHACKRLGVLAEKTMGYRDLVCDFDTRITWNGRVYAFRPAK